MNQSAYSLKPLEGYSPFPGPVVCVVMDGVGLGKKDDSDGVHLAYTPVLDNLIAEEPLYCELKAHGEAVGMPTDDDMGNSEVGHNTLGAGRVFPQGAKRVNEAIASGDLFEGASWKTAVSRAQDGGTLHLMGLLSDGNVHSHIDQIVALIDRAAEDGVKRIRMHVLLDGRDVGERSALGYIAKVEGVLTGHNAGGLDYRIASGGGRMLVTMDRYNADWPMVEKGWRTHVQGDARQFASATEAVETMYAEDEDVTDQYLEAFVIADEGAAVGPIVDGDSVIFYNFRGDRAIEMSMAFDLDDFDYFDRGARPEVFFAGLIQYDGDQNLPENFLLEPASIDGVLSHYLSGNGVTSYAVSETQKYGHVTYFWNGNLTGYVNESLEKHVEIPSDNVPFDQRPWMKAAEITDAVLETIKQGDRKFIRLNYPNGDMVGHTGDPAPIRISVEAVDHALARLLKALKAAGGTAVILADHGNADLIFTEKAGQRDPMVAHTLNPVPCIIKDFSGANAWTLNEDATKHEPGLANVAATICTLLGFTPPADYEPALIQIRD